MTELTHTPPALRWVALFLAACAALGLFLGFRDQIRKNPPGWYTGAEQIATPLPAATDGAREAVAFEPSAARPAPGNAPPAAAAPAPKAETPAVDATDPATDPAAKPGATTRPKPATAAARAAQPADPVGDILEGQKESEPAAPPTVPY